jgi:hypothetical protein
MTEAKRVLSELFNFTRSTNDSSPTAKGAARGSGETMAMNPSDANVAARIEGSSWW